MSELQANNGVVKPSFEEIRARERAYAASLKEQKSGSGKSAETGSEVAVGRSLANYASIVGKRAILLKSKLADYDPAVPISYAAAMRRFDQLQSMAGLVNISLTHTDGVCANREVVTPNSYAVLLERKPQARERQKLEGLKDQFLRDTQVSERTNGTTLLANFARRLDSLQAQELGADIKSEIDTIKSELEVFTETMLAPEKLRTSTCVEITDLGEVHISNLSEGYRDDHNLDGKNIAHKQVLTIEANPYRCAQVPIEEVEQCKNSLRSILSRTWTLTKKLGALSRGHQSMPTVGKAIADLEGTMLGILQASDRYLHRELKQIQAAAN